MNAPIHPDYQPLQYAKDRIVHHHGIGDVIDRLWGLLTAGKLKAWCSNRSGEAREMQASYWTMPWARRTLAEDKIFLEQFGVPVGRPVFRESDLDGLMPLGPPAVGDLPAPSATRSRRGSPELERAMTELARHYPDGVPTGTIAYGKVLAEINVGKAGTDKVKESTLERAVNEMRGKKSQSK